MQSSRKNFQSKEAFHRMNYLYQATDFSRSLSGRDGLKLMLHFGNMLHNVARKTVSRHEISLKRRICKNCHCILVPGNTCIVRLLKKPQQVMWLCVVCGTYKVFNTKKDHKNWTEMPEAIVEVINCASTNNASSEENVCGQVDKLMLDEHNKKSLSSSVNKQ
uniref:Putative ribonuclease p protein subunit p21 rhodnius neglectus n=2 Tax=Rhodnius TaxID=13248 RepID=A0A4P6D9Z1_RHOPR